MRGTGQRKSFLIFIILIGAIGGSLLGDALGNNVRFLSVLKTAYSIGISRPFLLDLKVLKITFGLNLNINIMSIIGVILAIILYRKH